MAPETGATLDVARPRKTLSAKLAVKPEPEAATAPTEQAQQPQAPAPSPQPQPPAEWSDEDERLFQALAARRKAARGGRRGRDVGGQVLRPGEIAPHPGTVVATIVTLVAELGTVTRAGLVKAMGKAAFAHPKAKPQDAAWCQGYIAGALRDGFLALADQTQAAEQ